MGHWGDGPFDNDYAADVRDAYIKRRRSGHTAREAIQVVQTMRLISLVHLAESLRGLVAILADKELIGPEDEELLIGEDDAAWVNSMIPSSADQAYGLARLTALLATKRCLEPVTAAVVLEFVKL